MGDESGEKTEEPTQKKIDDTRKKGQVWKSKDLTSVLVFATGLSVVKVIGPMFQDRVNDLFRFVFDATSHPQDLRLAMVKSIYMAIIAIGLLSIPVIVSCAIVGGLADFLMVGPLLSADAVMPKLDKLNPLAGLKNMFSKKSFVELLKSMLKIFITGYVVVGVVRDAMGMVSVTIRNDAPALMTVLGELVFRVSVRVSLLFLVFAIFDVWFQQKTYMKDLMMTKDEVKREYKESEGDPHHKAKRREMHMEILEGAQMDAVGDADVVVTNPTHYAIAIKYDKSNDGAPRVICKGLHKRAEAIKERAKKAEIPEVRNVPLAHALYRVEVGQEIPEDLYDAVAEILNFVYGLKTEQESKQPVRAV